MEFNSAFKGLKFNMERWGCLNKSIYPLRAEVYLKLQRNTSMFKKFLINPYPANVEYKVSS